MIPSAQTEALVALEDSAPDVLFETFPGTDLAIWPLLRSPLIQSMAESNDAIAAADPSTTDVVKPPRSLRGLLWRGAQIAFPSQYSPRSIGHKDLLFVVRGTTLAQTNSGLKNWFVGDFATSEEPRSAILQDRGVKRAATALERPSFGNTFSLDRDIYLAKRKSDAHSVSSEDAATVRAAVREIYRALPFTVDEGRISRAADRVIDRGQFAPHMGRRFARIIDRVRPKLAFVQTAAYFNNAVLTAVLKDRGVLVVEPQHGWIGPSHGAYNFGAAIARPELARYMPDILLTFGDFWSGTVRFPGDKIAIGKPHLEQTAALAPDVAERDKVALVVSNAYQPGVITRFTKEIRDSLPSDWRVLFRPHPLERAGVEQRYPGLVGESRIDFDKTLDVNQSLAGVRAVFGFFSTVLYEALAFGCDAFVFDSPMADLCADKEIFGERVSDRASVRAAIDTILDRAPQSRDDSASLLDSIWKPHAIDNFQAFVRDKVDGP